MFQASIKGRVKVTVQDAVTLAVVREEIFDNIQTNFSLASFGAWVTGTPNSGSGAILPPNKIQLGTGSPPPSQLGAQQSDSALWSPTAGTLYQCDTIQTVQTYYAQFVRTYTAADPVANYTEVGLLDAAGNLWGHVVINTYKSNSQLLTIQWQVFMQASAANQNALITNYTRIAFAKWMTGTSNVSGQSGAIIPPTQMILGTGTGTVTIQDTSLFSPVTATLATCDYETYISQSTTAQFARTWQSGATGNYTEIGLQDTAGNLWGHALLPSGSANNASNQILSAVQNIQLTAA